MKNLSATCVPGKTMQDYILEQPAILHYLVSKENVMSVQHCLIQQLDIDEQPVSKLVMIASGTSYNAAIAASHYIPMPVDVFYPYEFTMYSDLQKYPSDCLFVVVSQGGESIETYNALAKVKASFRTLAVTCAENSTIASYAQASVPFGCGTETVIYRTKGFTASLMTLIIIGKLIARDHSLGQLAQAIPAESVLSDFIHRSIAFFHRHASTLAHASALFFISAGANRIIGYEAALKAIETIRLPAMAYELEEFLHGPQNAVNDTSQMIIIENSDDVNHKAWNLFSALRKLNKNAYFIAALDHTDHVDYVLKRPLCQIDEIVTICTLQQLCYTFSQQAGVDLTRRGFPELANYIKKTF